MGGPYLAVNELLTAPTGIDWSSVPVRNATALQQQAEARRLIWRATRMANRHMQQQVWATRDTIAPMMVPSRYATMDNGDLIVFTPASPIIDVDSVTYSSDAQNYNALQGTIQIRKGPGLVPDYFRVVLGGYGAAYASGGIYGGWIEVTYRTGYANAKLTTDVDAGVLQLPVDDPTGILPGDTMIIYDDADQEDVTVSPSYVEDTTPVPITTVTQYAHKAGVFVSEMDESIKEAVILIATDLVRQRGKDTVAISSAGGARVVQGESSSKIKQAYNMLEPWVRRL